MKALLLVLLMALAPQVKVTFYTPDVVRIQKVPEGSFPEGESLAVIAAPEAVPVTVKSSRGGTVYTSARLRVTVDVNGHVTFANASGKTLLVITHDPEFILNSCQSVIRMEHGKIVEQYPLSGNENQLIKTMTGKL